MQAERRRRYRKDRAAAKAAAQTRRDKLGALALADKQRRGCEECRRVSDPFLLEHHHKDAGTKLGCVSKLAARGVSVKRITVEMRRCAVLCVNCHAIETAASRVYYTARLAAELTALSKVERRRVLREWLAPVVSARRYSKAANLQRQRWVVAYKSAHGCADCDERRPAALQFDHDDPTAKLAGIATLVARHAPLTDVIAEASRCTVRCGNCHGKRTAAFWDRRMSILALSRAA